MPVAARSRPVKGAAAICLIRLGAQALRWACQHGGSRGKQHARGGLNGLPQPATHRRVTLAI